MVPQGLSVWELSVDAHPEGKAESDYTKRTTAPDGSPTAACTYVELILRPWTKRSAWSAEKTAEATWAHVRAYGLDDIEAWLETAPVTWAWFSEELGLSPYGMQTAETWWNAWSSQTSPAFQPDVVLAGRDQAIHVVQSRLRTSGVTTLEGASLDEACAFLAAMAVQQDRGGDGTLMARLAFVDDRATWRALLDSPSPLVLVPLNVELALEAPSTTRHTVLVPVTETRVADVELPRLNASGVAAALKVAGMEERKAERAGRLARRSLTALRRYLAQNPALHRPSWAEPPVPRHVRAALLAGSWDDQREGDQRVISDLAADAYDAFREAATELTLAPDPFILQVGGSWHVVSPFDAWLLLINRLTEDDLRRFEGAVTRVVGELDPALDVPEGERWWKASFEGKVRAFSPDLRRGLARSLALLGVHGDRVSVPGGTSGAGWAAYLVRALLKVANEDPTGRTWVSLSDLLPLLAEAAPDAVVDAVTSGSSGQDPVLAKLFTDDKDNTGLFSSNSPHTHLLWALERLAWSPEHFGAAIELLGRLDELDPGGRLSNRPDRTLAAVFRPWHPENSATPERRLKVIDQVRRRHPNVAWKLLRSMLPESHATHISTNAPEYRDWKPLDAAVTRGEYMVFISAVVARCIEDAGTAGGRWQSLLSGYSNLAPVDRATVVAALTELVDTGSLVGEDADQIWTALRDLVGRHREFADAQWALPEDALVQLDALVEKLQPKSAFARHEWLFQDHMPHVGDVARREDHEAYTALVADRRRTAIRDIEAEGGLEAVRRLVSQVEVRWSVGIALADACPTYDDQLLESLDNDDATDLQLAEQYLSQRFRQEGWLWLDAVLQHHAEASPLQRARLLLAARDLPRAWEVAEELGREVAEHFWKLFVPYGLGGDFHLVEFVAEHLMEVGRNAMAVDFVHMYLSGDGAAEERFAQLIARGLDGLLAAPDDPEIRALSSHDFESSLKLLERHRGSIGVDRLARLEWGLLPALGHDPDAPALHEGMATNPAFFVDVVCSVYRSRNEDLDPEHDDADDEQRQARAHNGYRLLSSWHHPPGLSGDGIDAERLHEWLEEAERLLRERGRLEVGLVHLGQVLASAPPDDGATRPPRVVRDLLEELQSEEVESGLSTELFNRRGVTSRGLEEGGAQEASLAAEFRADADRFADEWPRIAALYRRIASSYEADARRNEESAERFRRGLD